MTNSNIMDDDHAYCLNISPYNIDTSVKQGLWALTMQIYVLLNNWCKRHRPYAIKYPYTIRAFRAEIIRLFPDLLALTTDILVLGVNLSSLLSIYYL